MEKTGLSLNVLLIGDDLLLREVIREYLEMDGRYQVHEVSGVYHALALCESRWPLIDVVLIDMAMTRVDVVELILAIRDRRPDMAILGTTDRPSELYEEPRLRTSRAGFIPGPFSATRLRRCIQAVLKSEALEKGKLPSRRPHDLSGLPVSRASARLKWV